MKITATNRPQLRTVEVKLTLTHEEVELLTKSEFRELSDFTQVVLRNYGLVNHRNKPTDLARDIASTLAFVTPPSHDFPFRLRPATQPTPSTVDSVRGLGS